MDFYQGQDWKIEKILWSSGQMEFVYRNTFDMPQNRIVPMAKWLFFIKKIKKENKNKISGWQLPAIQLDYHQWKQQNSSNK